MRAFPCSGEINRTVRDVKTVLAAIEAHYGAAAEQIDRTDGLGMEMGAWRFNVRGSNTEPVLRVNVESRGDIALMNAKTKEILELVAAAG
jgi:phosphomannomutase